MLRNLFVKWQTQFIMPLTVWWGSGITKIKIKSTTVIQVSVLFYIATFINNRKQAHKGTNLRTFCPNINLIKCCSIQVFSDVLGCFKLLYYYVVFYSFLSSWFK